MLPDFTRLTCNDRADDDEDDDDWGSDEDNDDDDDDDDDETDKTAASPSSRSVKSIVGPDGKGRVWIPSAAYQLSPFRGFIVPFAVSGK